VKISVITVCFNAKVDLQRTLESVISQDYSDYEYIIVDGGSTDGTLEVVEKYRDRLNVVVSEPDHGIADAFNKGIRLSSGDIIGILSAGDLYDIGSLSAVAETF